jgi:hypothetical protein
VLALVDHAKIPASGQDRMATRIALLPHRAAIRGLDIYEVINFIVYLESPSALVGNPHVHVVRALQLGETELPC